MSKKPDWKLHPESAMMSHGYDPSLSEGAAVCPEFHATTYVFKNAREGKEFFKTPYKDSNLIYSRLNHPNLQILEERLALWEEAEACAAFGSGMAAIFALCFEFLRPGDTLLYSETLYGGTTSLFNKILAEWNIHPVSFNNQNLRQKLNYLMERGTLPKIIFIETPANPTNSLIDIETCRKEIIVDRPLIVVDNTLLGPIFQHPLKHGADISMYSATKYIGGHSDAIAGACLGSHEYIERLKKLRIYMGNNLNPDSASRLLRSLQTLDLRMRRQAENAMIVARYLENHSKVEKVFFLGLLGDSDNDFNLYKKQCLGPGGLMSFDIKGGELEAFSFLDSLTLFKQAVSLGSTESLAQHPYTMTHAGVPPEEKEKLGITEKMVRLSIGVEHPQDLIRDLEQALAKI